MNSGGQNIGIRKMYSHKKVFYYFEELAGSQHGSYHTKAISDYCMNFAKERELEAYQDALIMWSLSKKPQPDMRMQKKGHGYGLRKRKRLQIDFENEGLRLFIDGDFVKAKGTTGGMICH